MQKTVKNIIIIWLIIICCFVLKQEITLQTGRIVNLRTYPVDPRDLLRGDYVILNYEIAQLGYRYSNKFNNNEKVFVKLKVDKNNVATVDEITKDRPTGALYLKGNVGGCNTTIPFYKTGKCVNFGIESYFVKEGTGRNLERKLQKGALVQVAIDKQGSSKVVGFVEKNNINN